MIVNNVADAKEIEILYKSDIISMTVVDQGSYVDGSVTVDHNLGFIPIVIAQRYEIDPLNDHHEIVLSLPKYGYSNDDGSLAESFEYEIDSTQITFRYYLKFGVIVDPVYYFRFLLLKEKL